MEKFDIIVTTLFGFEDLLAAELREIGVTDMEISNLTISFKGDNSLLYKCNLLLRTAVKVLKPIDSFIARNEQELYDKIKKIKWDTYINYKNTFAINGSTHGSVFTHSQFVALKSKDAIADQFREKYDIRPSVDTENPDLRIHVHIKETNVFVSLDSSGSSLSKRNYKFLETEAPISEVLAAGIILLSEWDKKSDFISPMCGSGTFAIEAALMAKNIPSGKFRNFGFEKWKDFDSELWNKIKAEADEKIIPFNGRIIAHDIDKKSIEVAIKNAKNAQVSECISFKNADFFQSSHESGQGIVIINPPYGERLEIDEISNFYKEMGTRLKHFYPGCDAWVISSNYEAFKFFGLRPSRKIKLYNGSLECRLQKFELYQGSKKAKKNSTEPAPVKVQAPVEKSWVKKKAE